MVRAQAEESFDFQIARGLLETVPRIMAQIRHDMRLLAKSQLTIAQLRILAKLYRGASTISEMADWQGVSVPAMSKMVGIVESRGLVQRQSQSQDRRQIEVSLTDDGRRVFLSIRKLVRSRLAEKIRGLSEAKKQVIFDAVQVLNELYE